MFTIFDELAAEEIRKDRMQEAENYKLITQSNPTPTPKLHYTLGKMGAALENWGAKIRTRYNYPAPCEKHELLVKTTK